jgi:hypothetical protein
MKTLLFVEDTAKMPPYDNMARLQEKDQKYESWIY